MKTHLTIRNVSEEDLKDLYEWRNSDVVRESSIDANSVSFESHEIWWKYNPNQDAYFLALDGDKKIGVFSFEVGKHGPARSRIWSFNLNPEWIGAGYGRKMCEDALTIAWEQLKANKVVGEVLETNKASIALHKKLGFKKVGIYEKDIFREGQLLDLHVFEILNPKFKKKLALKKSIWPWG